MSDINIHLTLFLKYTTTMRHLDATGVFDREFSLYRRLQDLGVQMSVVTHGGRDEYDYHARIPGMRILCNWIGWKPKRYLHRLHRLHLLHLLPSNIFKTDEIFSGYEATRSARALKKSLVARAGYFLSHNTEKTQPENPRHINWVKQIEKSSLEYASVVFTSTEELRQSYIALEPSVAQKSAVMPMHVDTELFKPRAVAKRYQLIFVGRFAAEKNVRNLLEAVRRTGASIALVGWGELEDELRADFGDLAGQADWIGHVKNEELPALHNAAAAYILPSLFEGQPRAMVEAMASGLPVIGARVRGIASTLQHGRTGYLCDTDVESIAAAIEAVLAQPAQSRRMGERAREYALEHHSLDRIAAREYEIYQAVLARQRWQRAAG